MKQVNWKKLLLPNLPYVFIALFCTKLGQAARLAPGEDFAGKFLHFMEGLSAAFAVPLPSFHPADLCVGIACTRSRRGQKCDTFVTEKVTHKSARNRIGESPPRLGELIFR